MKKIIKPAEREEALYYSDFTGKPLDQCGPEVELKMNFSYGSKYDNSRITLHLSDKDAEEILSFLSTKLTKECRKEIQNTLEQFDVRYDDAMDSRAWHECDIIHNNREVLKKLLNLE
jgi:hypothetical protein